MEPGDLGPAGGDTVVLLHGSAGSGAVWRRYVDDLQALGYRVVASDIPTAPCRPGA